MNVTAGFLFKIISGIVCKCLHMYCAQEYITIILIKYSIKEGEAREILEKNLTGQRS